MNARTRWAIIFACIGLAAAIVGCRPRPQTAVIPASSIAATPRGDVTVWSWNIAAKSLQSLVPAFEKRRPDVNVKVDMTGARMQTRLMLSLISGVGAPDVSQFELVDAPHYIATGKLADLTPVAAKYRSMFPAYAWDNCMMNGRVYAIPWDVGPCAVFYKRDILERYGVDPDSIETWDDFIVAGKAIQKASGGKTRMLPLPSSGLSWQFQMLMQLTGGQLFDAQGRIAVNSPENRRALDVIRKLKTSGTCVDVAYFGQEFFAGINDDSIATFPLAVWLAGTMKDTARDYPGKKHVWGVFPLPAVERGGPRVANLGGSVLVIPEASKNKAAAWAFVEYALCTREGQIPQYRDFSLYPAFLPALKPPGVDEPDPFFGGQRTGLEFAKGLTDIRRLNITPQWREALNYTDQALSHWAATGMRSEGFFEDLERKMQRRLNVPVAPKPAVAEMPSPRPSRRERRAS